MVIPSCKTSLYNTPTYKISVVLLYSGAAALPFTVYREGIAEMPAEWPTLQAASVVKSVDVLARYLILISL